MKLCNFLLALVLLLSGTARAGTVLYHFDDINGNLFAASSVPLGLSASNFDLGSPWGGLCSIPSTSTPNNFACGGFGNSQSNFTVQAQAGFTFDVLGFTFDSYRPSVLAGVTAWAVYSSMDSFSSVLASGDFTGLAEETLQVLTVPLTAQGLQGPLTLRIVSTGRDSLPASAWLLDNVRLEVDVKPLNNVPEPPTVALLLAGVLGAFGLRRRRKL